MTDMPTPRRHGRTAVKTQLARSAAAIVALVIASAAAAPALAFEPQQPSATSRPYAKHKHYRKYRDRGVTVIIIDEDDRSTSTVRQPKLKAAESLPAPSGRIDREDDTRTKIIIKNRTATSPARTNPGPKVIIVDRNSGDCDGVCVIRP